MEVVFAETTLVVLCGVAGCGKSTFAKKYFEPTAIVSSDQCRAIVCDDEENMGASSDAFDLFYSIIEKRMKYKKTVVADSTALSYETRKRLVKMGKDNGYDVVIIALNIPVDECIRRNSKRERVVSQRVIEKQYEAMERTLKYIDKEGFDQVILLQQKDVDDFKCTISHGDSNFYDSGPFDIISDVHGCCSELEELLERLGYVKTNDTYVHTAGRRVIFSGDIVDRGPRVMDTIGVVTRMVKAGSALYVPGNHCNKFYRYLKGKNVQVRHGLEKTVTQYDKLDKRDRERTRHEFIKLYENSPIHLVLDHRRLVIAHAGIKEYMIGKSSKSIDDFVLYGDVTGEVDEKGFPVRGDWASDYCGKALIVYGHTPVNEPLYINNTVNIDLGVSIGGNLAAFKYPEREIVMVKAKETYYTEGRQKSETVKNIDLDDFSGELSIKYGKDEKVRFSGSEVTRALEILQACNVQLPWIVYLPPFTSSIIHDDLKNQVKAAVDFYRHRGARKIVIQSVPHSPLAVVVVCRDNNISRSYFLSENIGEIYSINNNLSINEVRKQELLQKLSQDIQKNGYFEKNNAEFIIFKARLIQSSDEIGVIPLGIAAFSCYSCYNKDNIWQMENIDVLSDCSDIFIKSPFYVLIRQPAPAEFIENAEKSGSDIIVMPVKPDLEHRGNQVQPEILCSSDAIYSKDYYQKIAVISHELALKGVEKFIEKKLSDKYLKYIIGNVCIYNRVMENQENTRNTT